jgi:hypothetical protein
MRVDGRGGCSGDSGRVGLGLLLLVLALFPKEAISGVVNGPSHVVLAPIEGKFSNFLPFLALPRLGQFLFPCLIFLLFLLVQRVLFILFFEDLPSPFFPLPAMALSLGSSLNWPFKELILAAIATIFSSSGDLAPHFPLVFKKSNLRLAMDIIAS